MEKIIPGKILAQEEIKSSSSDNIYTVTLYDNCVSCTCPAGNKKEYCEHMQDLIYKNWQTLKKHNEKFYNKTFILKDALYGHCEKLGEYLLLADELIYIADEHTAEQAHFNIIKIIENHKQKLNELIDSIESIYSKEQQKEILEYFWKAEKNSYIPDSPLLFDLLNKGFLKISDKKHISYRIEKYFTAHNIEKISEKKEFIFNHLPNTKGLKRGKSASYNDTIYFIEDNYSDLFDNILSDFKSYDFGDVIGENGHLLALYFYRSVGNGSNYKFNYKTEEYELKNDEITQIMINRGFKLEKPTGDPRVITLKFDFSETINKYKEQISALNFLENSKILMISSIVLLLLCWPIGIIVGIYYFIKRNKSKKVIEDYRKEQK